MSGMVSPALKREIGDASSEAIRTAAVGMADDALRQIELLYPNVGARLRSDASKYASIVDEYRVLLQNAG